MEDVKLGMRGPEVKYLQRLLNLRLPEVQLREDGVFDPRTHLALVNWQEAQDKPVGAAGLAGRPVFEALGMQTMLEHWVQPYKMSGGKSAWPAALITAIAPGPARRLLEDRERMGMNWMLAGNPNNIPVFAGMQRLRNLSAEAGPGGPDLATLTAWMQQGVIIAFGAGLIVTNRWDHACVLCGLYSDGNPDASGTMLRVHDPLPAGTGSEYGAFWGGYDYCTPYRQFNLREACLLSAQP